MFVPFSSLIADMDTKQLARIFIKNALDVESYSNGFEKFLSNFSRRPKVRIVVKNLMDMFGNLSDRQLDNVISGINNSFNLSLTRESIQSDISKLVMDNFPLKSDNANVKRSKALRLAKFLKDLVSIALDDTLNEVVSSVHAVATAEEE